MAEGVIYFFEIVYIKEGDAEVMLLALLHEFLEQGQKAPSVQKFCQGIVVRVCRKLLVFLLKVKYLSSAPVYIDDVVKDHWKEHGEGGEDRQDHGGFVWDSYDRGSSVKENKRKSKYQKIREKREAYDPQFSFFEQEETEIYYYRDYRKKEKMWAAAVSYVVGWKDGIDSHFNKNEPVYRKDVVNPAEKEAYYISDHAYWIYDRKRNSARSQRYKKKGKMNQTHYKNSSGKAVVYKKMQQISKELF